MIFHKTFTTATHTLNSATRMMANGFANTVWMADEENQIISISECETPWGSDVTVWYKAKEEVIN